MKKGLASTSYSETLAFKIQLPELNSLNLEKAEIWRSCWSKVVGIVPIGTFIHKQDCFQQKVFSPAYTSGMNHIEAAQLRLFEKRTYMTHHCFLFISIPRRSADQAEAIARQLQDVLKELNPQFLGSITESTTLSTLMPKDSGDFYNQAKLSNHLAPSVENYAIYALTTPDVFLTPALAISSKLPNTSEKGVSEVRDRTTEKTELVVSDRSPLGTLLPINHIYNQFIFIPEQVGTANLIDSKLVNYKLAEQLFGGLLTNKIAKAIPVLDQLSNDYLQAERHVKFHAHVLIWPDDSTPLISQEALVRQAFAKMNIQPVVVNETSVKRNLLMAVVPGKAAYLPAAVQTLVTESYALKQLTAESFSNWDESENGVWVTDRNSGQPLQLDLSEKPYRNHSIRNRNKLIIGTAGLGRSFLMHQLICSYHERSAPTLHPPRITKIILIESDDDYSTFTQYVAGIRLDLSQTSSFNPFICLRSEPDLLDNTYFLIELIKKLWKGNLPLNRLDYNLLQTLIEAFTSYL